MQADLVNLVLFRLAALGNLIQEFLLHLATQVPYMGSWGIAAALDEGLLVNPGHA